MKKVLLILALSLTTVSTFTSCREKSGVEKAADDVGDAAEDVADDIEDATN